MRPIEQLGLGPSYKCVQAETGNWEVTVTPPAFTQLPPNTITLTADQYERFLQWRDGGVLIQSALPELSDGQREILMTGIGDDDFARICDDDGDA